MQNQLNGNEPNALDSLPNLRAKILGEIAIALKRGGKSDFYEATERLRTGDSLLEQVVALWSKKTDASASPNQFPKKPSTEYESAKQRGERVRSNWVNTTLGRTIKQIRGTLYQGKSDEIIGIGYAKEAENRRGRWFAGLPADELLKSAILLCESVGGKVEAVCLPTDFITRNREKFSVSHGQLKFNIIKRLDDWVLSVRGSEKIPISENLNKISLVI
jgi:hypothetical protein